MDKFVTREAQPRDLDAINAIYNHYVLNCTCTFQTESSTAAERVAWFAAHGPVHPVIVAELEDEVVGWAALSPFHPRAAYRRTVEDSVYVREDRQGRGLGRALLNELIRRARAADQHVIVGLISADQPASLRLHERYGFVRAGHLHEVGHKFGRWLDVIFLELLLPASSAGFLAAPR